jgi:antitoxin MazE
MTTLIRIGNSQGVRIPKAIIKQAKLDNHELDFKIVDEGLLICPVKQVRQGWKKEFDRVSTVSEQDGIEKEWLDAKLIDDEEWEW